MLTPDFYTRALTGNSAALVVNADALIRAEMPGQAVIPCEGLELEVYQNLGFCQLESVDSPRPIWTRYWGGEDCDQLNTSYEQVVWRVTWNEHVLQVVHLAWESSCGGGSRDWVVAESAEIADAFILDIERKTHAPGEAILVFTNGYWRRSQSLYQATQSASFEDLILADNLKSALRNDFQQFLKSEERYLQLGIAWRRGALIIGPPGNGKTHAVRALIKELNIASLYVQSLQHNFYTPEQLWHQVFQRARGLRPCVLVLEDLDSLVTPENRSFFLNQLDGFEHNHGMIILATTNYPEKIDSAIINRPSRFDRKYHFELPAEKERRDYLTIWQKKLAAETGWKPEELDRIVIATDGFSFAYLKELVISTVMVWMETPTENFAQVMYIQTELLQKQMRTQDSARTKPSE